MEGRAGRPQRRPHSDASDYLWGATDPYYVQTNYYLNFYRLQVQNRAIQQGPPPYAYCP